ncbi:MAG: hypothetical protein J5I50_09135 [Chitinophagaceae bacterium]|nr:hypothetical protein [Chitinophagaceae bacterium]
MNFRCLAFLLIAILSGVRSEAQTPKIDSLINLLKTKIPDSTRANSLRQLAVYYETVDAEKSEQTYQESIDFSKDKKLYLEAGAAYFERSFLYKAQAKYQQAELSLDSAIIFLDLSDDSRTLYRKTLVYDALSGIYKGLNNYDKAIEYQLKANDLYEKQHATSSLVKAYLNTSVLYKELHNLEQQENYSRKVLAIGKETKDDNYLFLGYNYIAFALSEQSKYKEAAKYLDSAKTYFNKGLNLQADMTISFFLISGSVNAKLKNYNEAYSEFKKAYDFAEASQHTFSKYQSLLQMGNVRTLQKRYGEAEKILLEADAAIQKTGELSQKNILLQYLSDLYKDWGKYDKALEYYKKFIEVSDSITNIQNQEIAANLEKKYETEKKEATIQLQQSEIRQRKTMNYLFGGGVAALAIILLLTYRTYHQKQKIQKQRITELETAQRLGAAQAALKGEEQERSRLAKDLHDGLSGMLSGVKYSLQDMKGNLIMTDENRQAFERSIDMLDSSIKELRRVAHNMMPEVLVRYGLDAALKDYIAEINKTGIVKVVYQSMGMEGKAMEQSTALAIYRIIQELLNNVIKHAKATEVLVQLLRENGRLVVNVEDNGRGFDVKASKEKGGMGWRNIRSRVELLNGTIDLQSSAEKGTAVNLEFNIG